MMFGRQLTLLLAAALPFLTSCHPGVRLTKANVEEVTSGMARKQVEAILGMPTSVETKDYDLRQKTTYLYAQSNGTVAVVFWDDRVESKKSTLPE